MNFGKIITGCFLVICIWYFVEGVEEFMERPLSEMVKVKVEKKYCRSRDYETRVIVSYSGKSYNVNISSTICYNIEIGQTIELYYSKKLDKIFENTNKVYALLFVSLLPLILMVLYTKFKQ